jgi:hypothetical protein
MNDSIVLFHLYAAAVIRNQSARSAALSPGLALQTLPSAGTVPTWSIEVHVNGLHEQERLS